MGNKENNFLEEERELLHRQLELLAEQSEICASAKCTEELCMLSSQMTAIYSALQS